MWESGPLGFHNLVLVLLSQKSLEHQVSSSYNTQSILPRISTHSTPHLNMCWDPFISTYVDGSNFQRYLKSWNSLNLLSSCSSLNLLSFWAGWALSSHSYQWNQAPHIHLACLRTTGTLNFLYSLVKGTCSSKTEPTKIWIVFCLSSGSKGCNINAIFIKTVFIHVVSYL